MSAAASRIGRLIGAPDAGDQMVAQAIAAARAREEAARARQTPVIGRVTRGDQVQRQMVPSDAPLPDGMKMLKPPPEWALAAQHVRLLSLIVARSWEDRESLAIALFGARPRETDEHYLTSLLATLRKRVAPHGIVVPKYSRRAGAQSGGHLPRCSLSRTLEWLLEA